MNNAILRSLFIVLAGGGGFLAASLPGEPSRGFVGLLLGLVAAGLAILAAGLLGRVDEKALAGASVGLLLGLVAARLAAAALSAGPGGAAGGGLALFSLSVVLGYLGAVVGASRGLAVPTAAGQVAPSQEKAPPDQKILDTSVIIDGRIADICETGFLDGAFVVPQFVLRELQHIADSADTLKRNRGRRGLDILQRLQKMTSLDIHIVDTDFPRVREVDGKLIALAKASGAKIITNDFNLNKVAELQGVTVLNINQLANALKPVVLPGEFMKVYVLKEGKEPNQGVAYLDDGTMVVVDNGKKEIGRTIEVAVTSVLQTTAGRMIFTGIREELPRNGS